MFHSMIRMGTSREKMSKKLFSISRSPPSFSGWFFSSNIRTLVPFLPSHQRTQLTVNKWKNHKRTTTTKMLMRKTEKVWKWHLCERVPCAFSYFLTAQRIFSSLIFPSAFILNATHPCQEFIIISGILSNENQI